MPEQPNKRILRVRDEQQSERHDGELPYHETCALARSRPLLGLPADGFSYPVQPTYELHLRFDNNNPELVRYLASAGQKWYMVLPCPNQKRMALVHDNLAKAKAQRERAAQLIAELKDPLRTELLAMLKQHKMLEAVRRYQKVTGLQDFTLAVMVMNTIDPEHPLGNR